MDTLETTIAAGGGTFRVSQGWGPDPYGHVAPFLGFVAQHDLRGYTVGIAYGDAFRMRLKNADNYDLEAFMAGIARSFGVEYVGTWVHDGAIVIDPVVIIADKPTAVAVAKALNQEAIYDNAAKEVINL